MIIELGHYAFILALLCAAVQAGAGLKNDPFAFRAAKAQGILCLFAFVTLIYAYVTTDLSVLNVAQNSHSYKPLLYKISGAWGNHEGSMLLWTSFLALYGMLMSGRLSTRAVGVQGLLSFGFIAFTLFASSPFTRLALAPIDGNDLNPVLQDPALAFHPPFLYAGYLGFSVAFSAAVAALLDGATGKNWAASVKPFILWSWTTLSAGIALGSFWAYYELGWGGWWFWDPVENASLLPWLLGTALLHSVIVMEKRDALHRWSLLLAILTFSLAMLGTFLVRSGVLTSVHAFALDPARGLIILALIVIFTGGALILYGLRVAKIEAAAVFAPLSREGALVLNNLFLCTMTATVLTGTFYPLVITALQAGDIAVGPPYYQTTFIPLAIPLILLMAVGPFLGWKTADLRGITQRLQTAGLATGFILLVTFMMQPQSLALSLLGIGLSAWLVSGTLAQWAQNAGLYRKDKSPLWPRLKNMRAEQWCLALTHAGLGIAIAGMVGTGLWTKEDVKILRPGETMNVGRYTVILRDVTPIFGTNYSALRATITAHSGSGEVTLTPEQRHYPVAQKNTTEAAIHTNIRDDIYVVLGERDTKSGGWVIHAWSHPLIAFLWSGFIIMVLGGLIGLRERKHA